MKKIKKIRHCEVDGCNRNSNKIRVSYYKKFNMMLCNKHYTQMQNHNKIFIKTIYDPNEIIIHDDYAEIVLYNKQCKEIARTKIDIEDIEKLKQYKWCLSHGYAKTDIRKISRKMHQILIGDYIDHINIDPLDNRRSNLRKCNQQQNDYNKNLSKNNSSGVKGVSWDKHNFKWRSIIEINYKSIHLGRFKNKKDAVVARLKAERKYHKEFQNKILEKKTIKMFNIKEKELIFLN